MIKAEQIPDDVWRALQLATGMAQQTKFQKISAPSRASLRAFLSAKPYSDPVP